MENNKINALQLSSLVIIIAISGFLGSGFYCLIKKVSIDGYISILFGGVLGILIVLLLLYIANYEPALALNEKINKLCGNKLGFIINVILVVLVLILGSLYTYNLNNFISGQFLSETPISFITIIFAGLILYISSKGIETLSRVALLVVVLNLFLYMIALAGLAPSIELDNFLPFMKDGFSRPLEGLVYFIAINIIPIFLMLIVPKDNIVNKRHYNKYIIWTVIVAIFLMFFIFVTTIGNLGIYLTSSYQYPEYIILKRLSIFNFLDRIENVIAIQWILGLTITSCMIVYYVSKTIKKKGNSLWINIGIVLILSLSSLYAFKNNTIFNNFVYNAIPYISFSILAILLICSVIIFRTKSKSSF